MGSLHVVVGENTKRYTGGLHPASHNTLLKLIIGKHSFVEVFRNI